MQVEGARKFRNEWKYRCNDSDIIILTERIRNTLSVDEYAYKQDQYAIHSLYFDDYVNTCAADNAAGTASRYKWRIRYYDGPKPSLHLEYKKKYFGRTLKKSCSITKKELEAILDDNIEDILWKTKQPLLRRFCAAMMTHHFRPKAIIYYERTAYVEPVANVRITIDKNISVGYDFSRFMKGDYLKIPINETGWHILEVKFDDILPGYIRAIIESQNFKQATFSKYYVGRQKLEELI